MCAASIVHSLPEKQDKIGKLHLCLHGYRRRRAGITQSKKPSSSLPEQGEKKTAFFVCSMLKNPAPALGLHRIRMRQMASPAAGAVFARLCSGLIERFRLHQ